jgi:lactoylglutathione lyase
MTADTGFECLFDHVHIYCSDVEKTEDWFVQVLGATASESGPLKEVHLGGQLIKLRQNQPNEQMAEPGPLRQFGVDHIGVRVSDLMSAVEELRSRGAVIAREPRQTRPGIQNAWIDGPDAVRVEVVQVG